MSSLFSSRLACLLSSVLPLLSVSGCRDKANILQRNEIQTIAEANKLIDHYEEGGIVCARQSLSARIALLEGSTVLNPDARIGIIARDYARLYLLEKRSGNDPAAEAALIKVRYWYPAILSDNAEPMQKPFV